MALAGDTVTIFAAGSTNEETMQLLIDGQVVQTWNNVGGSVATPTYVAYSYTSNTTLSPDRVRVAFTNDLYNPPTVDRNLRIDRIEINSTTYESEAPTVFSTGTWTADDGVQPGFRQSEFLHTNGYFQYRVNNGSIIQVIAAGWTGNENMELQIDGQAVAGWNRISGNPFNREFIEYTYRAAGTVTADRVRVAFTNDFYQPPSIDYNITVDKIIVDGVEFESEAPTVFSTGTWTADDGVQPGFRQSEVLHTNGYFQYKVNSGSIIQVIAAGWTGNENIELQIDGQTVAGWNRISGNPFNRQFFEYTYRASDMITADRVQVAFTNDFYQPPSIDYNITVDKIIVDGVEFESEAPTTYSTGTYVPDEGTVVSGYWQSEILHANGYLEYMARPAIAGNLGLETSVYAVNENAGNVTVAIVRTGGSDGVVSITYRTNDGTALSGSDYSSATGTLSFAEGETRKTVSIPILNNATAEAPETFSFVIDNPTGGAALLAPRTATVTITDDDLILPNYASFPSSIGLRLNGNASIASNTLQLTPALANQVGSAYYATPIPINIDTSFQTQFQFRVPGGTNGADGMAFVIQNSTAGSTALGTNGGGLGYEGVLRSLAVEFDTYQNAGEINDNHISIWRDGNLTTSLGTKVSGIDLNSGSPVFVWIDYNGDSDLMAIFLATTNIKPTTPFFTVPVDLSAIVGTQAFFGFSAGTGGLFNTHQVLSWQLNLNRPSVAPPEPVLNLVQETVVLGLVQPIAAQFSADGRNLYVAEKSGRVRVVRDGVMQRAPFIDISNQVNDVRDRGLLDIALHPNFAANPYVYLLFTYDPPEVYQNTADALAGPDKAGNRAGRLIRLTANSATNFTTAVDESEVVLLGTNSTWNNFNAFINSTFDLNAPQSGFVNENYVRDFIPTDSESHTVGSLAFAPDGSLYVSIGDGASYNNVDARAIRVQSVDSLSGKVLRVNPLNGEGYSNNPFFNGDLNSNRSKVYQSGLRNPFRISVNPSTGQLFVGDVGWSQWEEVNSAGPGANFGWPYYEGGSGNNLQTNGYRDLAAAQAFYASGTEATPAIYALNHAADGINAIVMGAAYTGTTYPSEYQNNIFFNDLGQGIVRAATVDSAGRITNVETFTTGAVYVVQIFQGRDGNLYFVDLDGGFIGRWLFVQQAATTTAERTASTPSTTSTSVTTKSPATKILATKISGTSGTNSALGASTAALGKIVFMGVGAANQQGRVNANETNFGLTSPAISTASTTLAPEKLTSAPITLSGSTARVYGPAVPNKSSSRPIGNPVSSNKAWSTKASSVGATALDDTTLELLAADLLRASSARKGAS